MNEEGKRLEEISASIKRHYDLLTDEEMAENRAWGEFAAVQFARGECSDEWQREPAELIGEDTSESHRGCNRPQPQLLKE